MTKLGAGIPGGEVLVNGGHRVVAPCYVVIDGLLQVTRIGTASTETTPGQDAEPNLSYMLEQTTTNFKMV